MRTKGLMEFLQDDPSLMEKITYQEYLEKKAAPSNNDYPIEEAYKEYCAVLKRAEEY